MRKAYLASIVPVIVNAVLNEHQVVVDIVAFVTKGDFPRSRLGEKQRGKILASWVMRKLPTIAQFGIRDADGADSQITEVAEPKSGLGSVIGVGSSLKNVETATSPPVHEKQVQDYTSLPTGISEMPVYESSIVESPPLPPAEEDRDDTPTEPRSHHNAFQNTVNDYSPVHENTTETSYVTYAPNKELPLPSRDNTALRSPDEYPDYQSYMKSQPELSPSDPVQSFAFDPDPPPPPARYDSKPTLSLSHHDPSTTATSNGEISNELWLLPSQRQGNSTQALNNRDDGFQPRTTSRSGISYTPSSGSSDHYTMDEDWRKEASGYMNLAQDGSRTNSSHGHGQQMEGSGTLGSYDGSGYGHAL